MEHLLIFILLVLPVITIIIINCFFFNQFKNREQFSPGVFGILALNNLLICTLLSIVFAFIVWESWGPVHTIFLLFIFILVGTISGVINGFILRNYILYKFKNRIQNLKTFLHIFIIITISASPIFYAQIQEFIKKKKVIAPQEQTNMAQSTKAADMTLKATINQKISQNTIKYDKVYYPNEANFTAKLLTTGTFHSDEVWKIADKEKWFGLFQGKTGFYIAETKLKTKRVNDGIVDEDENEKTGWDVQTVNKDISIILIEGLNFLTPHNVQQAVLSKDQIFPGDTLRINYLGIDYNIFATGGKKKVQDDPEWFDVWNYKLYLTATIKGQQHKSLLVAQPNFDDQMINLIFAGDIDGDGILDLIIDTSRHYNATSPTIYLSRPANKGEIVKPIGGHTSVGC